MKTTVINTNALAHHLRVAADQYDRDATVAEESWGPERGAGLVRTFKDQASQARAWADAVENLTRLGFDGDDIEVEHDDT